MSVLRKTHFWLLTPLSIMALPSTAHAQTDIRVSADASASVGYADNPFSQAAGDTGSGFAEIRVLPQVKLVDEHSILVLSGSAAYQRYFRRYAGSGDYGVTLDYSGTPSERLKTHLNFQYDNSIIGRNNLVLGAVDTEVPEPPVTSGTDLSLFGTRDRRQTLRGAGDLSLVLSDRDSASAGAYYVRSRYGVFGALGNYDGYGGSAGYSRRVSDHLQLGAQGAVARYNYDGALGDSTVYSAFLSFSATLGPRWKADGTIGASFVDSAIGGRSTAVSGNLRLCGTGPRSTLCLTVRRAVLPTGVSGTQIETSAGASYSYKVSERGTIVGAADYTRNGYSQFAIPAGNEFVRASLGYEHVLRERVRLTTSGQYREIFGGPAGRRRDYGGQLGIAVQLGDRR